MALVHEFEKSGNWLFKRRSWLPAILIIAAIIVLYMTNRQAILFDPVRESVFLAVSLLGEIVRILTVGFAPRNTSGRNTAAGQVADELNTSGIYSVIRHPLYVGNFLMWLGPVLFLRTTDALIFFVLVYWLYYERIMFAEEQFLRRKFGDVYDKWSENVKPVIPGFRSYVKPSLSFSVRSVLKREHNSFINIFVIFALLDVLRNYFVSERFYFTPMWLYSGVAAGILWVIIRVLHKRSTLLETGDR